MTHNFQIKSLNDQEFAQLLTHTDGELENMGAVRRIVDRKPGYPCRVSLEDAEVGEETILLNFQHHKTTSPYQATGAIFVRRNAATAKLEINEIPKMLEHRLLSIRAYDIHGIMKKASVCEGTDLRKTLNQSFDDNQIQYIHIHNAKEGCYHCVVERV